MFDSFGDFLAMGGYGGFVWSSYAICFGLMLLLAVQSLLIGNRRQRILQSLLESRMRHRKTGAGLAEASSTEPVKTGSETI